MFLRPRVPVTPIRLRPGKQVRTNGARYARAPDCAIGTIQPKQGWNPPPTGWSGVFRDGSHKVPGRHNAVTAHKGDALHPERNERHRADQAQKAQEDQTAQEIGGAAV